MPIPIDTLIIAESALDAYIVTPLPEHTRGKIRYGYVTRGMSTTLFEEHPRFMRQSEWTRTDIARFRYNKTQDKWTLYYRDRNNKWHPFPPAEPTSEFEALLDIVEEDPTGIFWG